jgi:hypothetical protein
MMFQNSLPVNSIEEFQDQLQNQLGEYYSKHLSGLNVPRVKINKGSKFYKIIIDNSVWGFIARIPMIHKGVQVRKGDLMKAAGWNAAAKHSRGNVIDGTAQYGPYGPTYLN